MTGQIDDNITEDTPPALRAAHVGVHFLKAQLNIEQDDLRDDLLLVHKVRVAQDWVGKHIGAPFDPDEPMQVEAAMMLAAHLYEQREAVAFGSSVAVVPFGVHALLESFKTAVTGRADE